MEKLKLMTIVGTRPEIIRLSAVITRCREHFDCILAHTGQNYDYNLNGVFFKDLKLNDPEVYMESVGEDLGETIGNIISDSYKASCNKFIYIDNIYKKNNVSESLINNENKTKNNSKPKRQKITKKSKPKNKKVNVRREEIEDKIDL